jgi:hypothetical protein
MVEAGNPDAIFTIKSAIYQAAFAAIYESDSKYNLTEKLLGEIPELRKSLDTIATSLVKSRRSEILEERLKSSVHVVLNPKMSLKTMKDVDADLAA